MLLYLSCQLDHYKHILWSLNRLRQRQNGRHFQMTYSSAFSWMKIYELRLIFHRILFLRVKLAISSIGSDNGLAPTRRQAIIWINDGFIADTYMCHPASMSESNKQKFISSKGIWRWLYCKINACQFCPGLNVLTHCDLVISNDDQDLGQHWPKPSPEPMMI